MQQRRKRAGIHEAVWLMEEVRAGDALEAWLEEHEKHKCCAQYNAKKRPDVTAVPRRSLVVDGAGMPGNVLLNGPSVTALSRP